MKRIISIIISAVIIFSLCAVGTNAAIRIYDYIYGDVDGNGEVDIADASLIRRIDLRIGEFEDWQIAAADYDRDGEANIIDATFVQRKSINAFVPDTCGGKFSDENRIYFYRQSYLSGKAMTGVPVSFIAECASGTMVDYYFSVKFLNGTSVYGAEIYEKSVSGEESPYTYEEDGSYGRYLTEASFTYSFENIGWYIVTIHTVDKLGRNPSTAYHQEYIEVVEPYSMEKPVVKNYYFDSVNNLSTEVTAEAIGGAAPYQYCFKSYDFENVKTDVWTSVVEDDNNNFAVTTGYIDENTVPLPVTSPRYGYVIYVTVKDANGAESEPCAIYVGVGIED